MLCELCIFLSQLAIKALNSSQTLKKVEGEMQEAETRDRHSRALYPKM